jgi:hypothetical protein
MNVCLLWVLCVVRYRSLRRIDHSSRGVLLTVARCCVWSRNLELEEAKTRYRAVKNTTTMGCNAKKTNKLIIKALIDTKSWMKLYVVRGSNKQIIRSSFLALCTCVSKETEGNKDKGNSQEGLSKYWHILPEYTASRFRIQKASHLCFIIWTHNSRTKPRTLRHEGLRLFGSNFTATGCIHHQSLRSAAFEMSVQYPVTGAPGSSETSVYL